MCRRSVSQLVNKQSVLLEATRDQGRGRETEIFWTSLGDLEVDLYVTLPENAHGSTEILGEIPH